MVRAASIDRNGMKRGAWSEEEDNKLRACVYQFGHPNWRLVPLIAGLKRCGKSCRLRWVNYLKPGVRRGNFTKDEQRRIIQLHHQLGNKWSAIAAYFPGRTDNDIKNYWHAHIYKRVSRAFRIQNPAEKEKSSDNYSSIKAGLVSNQDTLDSEVALSQPAAENMGVFELNADSSDAALFERCFSNLGIDHHNFVDEEFSYGGNIMCDSSKWGISDWNQTAAASLQPDFWTQEVEEDFFNIKLW